MIAELVSLGSSLKEALIYGLQISRDALESLLLAVHVETCEQESKSGACAYIPYLPDRPL
jgi:nitric oxide reductase NorQ protein